MTNSYARHLRRNQTPPEKMLWHALKARRLEGYYFRRQQPIDSYIVDFCCLEKRLIIEVDGQHHNVPIQAQYDQIRQKYLEKNRFKVLRLSAQEIFDNLEGVIAFIELTLDTLPA